MRTLEELRKINKRLNTRVDVLKKKNVQLQQRLIFRQARLDKLKEIIDLAIREKVI